MGNHVGIDEKFTAETTEFIEKLAERMPGFHWMTGYGDYMKELGYACKKVGITFEDLTA